MLGPEVGERAYADALSMVHAKVGNMPPKSDPFKLEMCKWLLPTSEPVREVP